TGVTEYRDPRPRSSSRLRSDNSDSLPHFAADWPAQKRGSPRTLRKELTPRRRGAKRGGRNLLPINTLPSSLVTYFPHICLAISAHFGLSDTVTCRLAGRLASRHVAPVSARWVIRGAASKSSTFPDA